MQMKEMDDSQKFELLSARINALVALPLPRYRATVEDGEVVDTSGGLTRERAEAELEFLIDWTATRTFNFIVEDIAPTCREAIDKLDSSIGNLLYTEDADTEERKRYICAAAIRSDAVSRSAMYPPELRELASRLSSLLFSASFEFTATGEMHHEWKGQIESLIEQIRFFNLQRR